jgi:hypothetical protein
MVLGYNRNFGQGSNESNAYLCLACARGPASEPVQGEAERLREALRTRVAVWRERAGAKVTSMREAGVYHAVANEIEALLQPGEGAMTDG